MWRLYATYGRQNAGMAALGAAMTLVARAAGLLPALLLGFAIDAVLLGTRPFALPFVPAPWLPATRAGQVWFTVAVLVGATAAGAAASWLQNYGWNRFAQTIQHALRVDAYEALQVQDRAFFDRSRTGELLAVLNNDVNQLESFLTDGVSSVLRLVALVVGVGVVLTTLNPWLALVTMAAVPVLAAFTLVFVRRVQPKYARMRRRVGELNARLENNVSGIEVIKTEGTEAYEAGRVRDASRAYYDANWDAIRTRMAFFPGLSLVSGLSFAATFAAGAFWVLNGPPAFLSGTLSPGEFVTFMLYTQQFVWPLAQFGQIVNGYQRAKASSERVDGLLRAERCVRERDDPVSLDAVEGRVEYDGVTFGYGPRPAADPAAEAGDRTGGEDDRTDGDGHGDDGNDADERDPPVPPVLRDVSFSLEPGETLGVVGPTGSGKSTLVKLLVRLYDPDEGVVRVDGHDVRDASLASLRRAVGYVSQEPFLFYGTVRENIAYGTFDVGDGPPSDRGAASDEAMDEAIRTAARRAAAAEFVENLPDGYDTLVGERGVKLSGGQRQRIALARTFLKDPPILVLDEATSHVDTETEALIRRSLDGFAADRTTIAIAHRLSTVKDADTIVVLDGGRIVERGTHAELLARDGLYANLWRVQAGDIEDLPESFFAEAIARRAALESDGGERTSD